ncbi:MAG TPA: tRNA 4-thiouridine(8) synthase ThiI [Nitrospinaceae bacterium]|nr:tRNA 4-thiouridine(8) synthase ThiI [Nitrospinaceae bacterium]HIO23743.1 tRNA 4-thiouridine(8) synthase ThiI [Nitrospinaceae bacterium]|tara:strand:+ start:1287 stop:2474 length:1188 start_codon:yes stop_codon:yes gene_type:complete
MKTKTLLIRYDEIGLKGRNRRHFENQLVRNIRYVLRDIKNVQIDKIHGRILGRVALAEAEKCTSRLTQISGIASISIGNSIEPDFDKMAELGVSLIHEKLQAQGELKFCVRTRRSNKAFPFTSKEVDFEVGSRIMETLSSNGLSVDINGAEFILEIEIGPQETIVFDNRVSGLSGLPVGSSGQVLSLLSGGIDSPVSTFKLINRGCRVHSIFFDNRTFLGRGGYDKVIRLAHTLNRFQGGGKLYVVPFQDIQVAIRDHCTDSNRVVLYRRMMYRIAHALAELKNCQGLVTGESVGQVASQTLKNLMAVSCVVPMSVLRPLIGMNKQEIITQAKKIGTYDISIEPQPDCCSVFMPDHPSTNCKIKYLEADERLYPWEELKSSALDSVETIDLDDLD